MTSGITLDAYQNTFSHAAKMPYQICHSDTLIDERWDLYLAQTPGGHHVQTSLWSRLKATLGWRAMRFIATLDGQIVGGAQVLMRSVPLLGAVGYVAKGPICSVDDPSLQSLVYDELRRVARKYRIQQLIVQPPSLTQDVAGKMEHFGLRPSSEAVATTTTLLIDLNTDLDTLLGQVKPRTRYNIRLSERKGVIVREGTESDLETYYRLLTDTGQRQGFSIYPPQYFRQMWRLLSPYGYIKLFLATYEGDVLSAQIAIPFGDTVINKLSVWSGRHGDRRPNEALQWAAICWAKSQGYRSYDFEGIDLPTAIALQQPDATPDSPLHTVTTFKLGFGGEVKDFSGPYSYIYNPLLRWGYSTVLPKLARLPGVERAISYFRTH